MPQRKGKPNFEALRIQLQPYIEREGRLPTKRFFNQNHRHDLVRAIRCLGGFAAIRELLGEPQLIRTGKHSMREWENARRRLEELDFPPYDELRKKDPALYNALQEHHGGYVEAKRRCGKDVPVSLGLDKWENLEPILRQIMKENGGKLPPSTFFWRSKNPVYKAVQHAIYAHYAGITDIRERLGLGLINCAGRRSLRYRENLDAILKPLVDALGYFPSDVQLRALKLHKITNACENYHGGLNNVREEYGYPQIQQHGEDSLRHWENLKTELLKLIAVYGYFPPITRMKSKLCRAICKYHGGICEVRKRLGFAPLQKAGKSSLRIWDNFLTELTEVFIKLGHFPSQRECISLRRRDIASAALNHHGGMKAVQSRFEALLAEGKIVKPTSVSSSPLVETLPFKPVKLSELLTTYEVELKKITDKIIRRIDGSFCLVICPYYSEIVKPVSLERNGEVYFVSAEDIWIVSLFLRLSSKSLANRRGAVKEIEEIAQGEATREKVRMVLTILRDAFMSEKDKRIIHDMDKLLEKFPEVFE